MLQIIFTFLVFDYFEITFCWLSIIISRYLMRIFSILSYWLTNILVSLRQIQNDCLKVFLVLLYQHFIFWDDKIIKMSWSMTPMTWRKRRTMSTITQSNILYKIFLMSLKQNLFRDVLRVYLYIVLKVMTVHLPVCYVCMFLHVSTFQNQITLHTTYNLTPLLL